MGKSWLKNALLVVFSFMWASHPAPCQPSGVDTDKIEPLIDEWNFAHNARNLHSFEEVYAPRLTLYADRVTRAKAIDLKRQLFRQKPWYRQRIVTEIKYSIYSPGVVKAEFTREVFEKPAWKKYRSYLLVSKQPDRYAIVSESDADTRRLKEKTDRMLREKAAETTPSMEEELSEERTDSFPPDDSPQVLSREEPVRVADSVSSDRRVDSTPGLGGIEGIFKAFSSAGMVTVPKGHVFILIAMLGVGGLLIFIADSIQSARRRRRAPPQSHADAQPVVRSFKVQAAFEAFVVTLFDPLYFRCFRAKAESVYAGRNVQGSATPDLIVDYNHKELHVRFGITTQYYQHTTRNEVQLLSHERQAHLKQFEADGGMAVYYVLGFGGSPDDPRELFLVPAREVASEYITRAELRRYSKSGMFYYHRRTGRIQ